MKGEYLLVLILVFTVPFGLSFRPELRIYKRWKALLCAVLAPSFLFWCWDIAAFRRGHWDFHPGFILGNRVLGLPVEEYLFFLVVAFVSIFTYEVIKSCGKRPS
jgi:lycopene cyclase domain-containing protein